MSRNLIIIEFIALFVVPPLVIFIINTSFYIILLPIFVVFSYAVWWLFFCKKYHWSNIWRPNSVEVEKKQLIFILLRFSIISLLILGIVLLLYPDKFLNFPLKYPLVFVLFIVMYPVFSVLPQELLYRTFFFERYGNIFTKPKIMIMASAIAFSYLHIMYLNYEAVVLTLVGGYFFSRSYALTRSLFIVCFEHSLYGILVFGLGMGEFFVRGLSELGLVL